MFHAVPQSVSRSTIGRPAFSILVLGIALLASQRMQAQSGYDAQIRERSRIRAVPSCSARKSL